jgi:hypothetical protein
VAAEEEIRTGAQAWASGQIHSGLLKARAVPRVNARGAAETQVFACRITKPRRQLVTGHGVYVQRRDRMSNDYDQSVKGT